MQQSRKEIKILKASKEDIEKLKNEIVKIKIEIEESKKLKANSSPVALDAPNITPNPKQTTPVEGAKVPQIVRSLP